MKCLSTAGLLALGLCVMATAASPALAQNKDRSDAGKLDAKTRGANVRASQIIGMTVRNMDGKDIGTVNDIVLDAATGRVRYAAVSYGGFLGLGDKLFAVPWQAFKCLPAQEGNEYLLVLNASEEKIKGAKGFNQDHWPDFGDREFTRGLDTYYGVEQRRGDRRGGVDVRVGPGGVDVDVKGKRRDRDD